MKMRRGRGYPLSGQCSGITREGTRCQRSADGPHGLCWAHDPRHADQRRRMASRAARSKPGRELSDIKGRLSDLADDVLEGRQDKGIGAVVSQILNVYLRAVSVELKVREQMELIERLERLEEALERRNGGSRWGA
jgi:hypothetical protein